MNDNWFKTFPTRTGDAQGRATERQMVAKVDISGFRTVIQNNPDGSQTMMRTRGGSVEFSTVQPKKAVTETPDMCIVGDAYEPPAAESVGVEWHSETGTIRSSDGMFSLAVGYWKKWTGRLGSSGASYSASSGELLHINFSSPSITAAAKSPAASADIQFIEKPFSSRTWHPRKVARVTYLGLVAIIQRLAGVTMARQSKASFTWTFSNDGGPASDVMTKPACMNKIGFEAGLTSRIFANDVILDSDNKHRRVKELNLILENRRATIRIETPYGFLPALKLPKTTFYAGLIPNPDPQTGTNDEYNASDLSRVVSIGQPWHGLCTQSGLEIIGFGTANLANYAPPVNGNTRYFKHPSPPSVDLSPSEFSGTGMAYTNDAVLSSGGRYAPTWARSSGQLPVEFSDLEWPHVGNDGVVRKLRLVSASGLNAVTASWNIYNCGPLDDPLTSPVLLGSTTLTTTDAYALTWLGSSSTTVDLFATGTADQQGTYNTPSGYTWRDVPSTTQTMLNRVHTVASSPDGRQIVVLKGGYFKSAGFTTSVALLLGQRSFIATVGKVDIGGDLVVGSTTIIYQFEKKEETDLRLVGTYTPFSVVNPIAPFVQSDVYWRYIYAISSVTTMTPMVRERFVSAAYSKDGALIIYTHKHRTVAGPVNDTNYFSEASATPVTSAAPSAFPRSGEVAFDVTYPSSPVYPYAFATTLTDECEALGLTGLLEIHRVTNNLIMANKKGVGPYVGGIPPADIWYVGAPGISSVEYIPLFPVVESKPRFCSFNPRTGEIAARTDASVSLYSGGSGWICWI